MRNLPVIVFLVAATALPAFSQADVRATVLKHLKISEDFTLKVAEAMPEADYGFKLTPAQMSFGEQMMHLSGALGFILAPLSGQKPASSPKAAAKADVIQAVRSCYEQAIGEVAKVTAAQLSTEYEFEGKKVTGLDLLLSALDHSTHHRASAEMYLRAKGITPPLYEF